jgi:hypothetical protein
MADDDNKRTPGFNMEDFSKKSQQYYTTIKDTLEKDSKGKFVALSYELQKYWIAETASEALKIANQEFPFALFYLVQIGSPSTFTILSSITNRLKVKKGYDFVRANR